MDGEGKVHLYNIVTGTEVTAGVWPYTGLKSVKAGAINEDYAVIHDRLESTGPLLVKLSDHSSVRRLTFSGSGSGTYLYYNLVYSLTDTHVIIGDSSASTGSFSSNGAVYAFSLSDNSQYTSSSVWPLEGTASNQKLTFLNSDYNHTIAARGGNLVYGAWIADTNGLTNNGIVGIYT
jgi:hypothetical protein